MATEYGSDISCVDDIDPDLSTVSGSTALLQAVARRWDTPPVPFGGGLFYDPDYGYGIRRHINAVARPEQIEAGLEAEALKDERVRACPLRVELLERDDDERRRPPIRVTASVVGADGTTYPLTLDVSSVTVALLREESQ